MIRVRQKGGEQLHHILDQIGNEPNDLCEGEGRFLLQVGVIAGKDGKDLCEDIASKRVAATISAERQRQSDDIATNNALTEENYGLEWRRSFLTEFTASRSRSLLSVRNRLIAR